MDNGLFLLTAFFKSLKECTPSDSYSGVPRNFFRGGGQQIQLRTEDRGDGYLGAVAP